MSQIIPKKGEHYWAKSAGLLLVVQYTGGGGYEVCGPWEVGMYEKELTLLQHIPRPSGTEDMDLYYPPDPD